MFNTYCRIVKLWKVNLSYYFSSAKSRISMAIPKQTLRLLGRIGATLEMKSPRDEIGSIDYPNQRFNRSCSWPLLSSHKSLFLDCSMWRRRSFFKHNWESIFANFCQNQGGGHFFDALCVLHESGKTTCSSIACRPVWKYEKTCRSVACRSLWKYKRTRSSVACRCVCVCGSARELAAA